MKLALSSAAIAVVAYTLIKLAVAHRSERQREAVLRPPRGNSRWGRAPSRLLRDSMKHVRAGDLHFSWDERKAATNFSKHRVSFDEAITVFADPLALVRRSGPLER